MIGCRVASKTSSCVEKLVKTLSNRKLDFTCLDPLPLMTVTVLSEVLALMTGRVPCFFSRSFSGRTRTTTWTDAVAIGDWGGWGPRREEEEVNDDEFVEEKDVWSEGVNILGCCLVVVVVVVVVWIVEECWDPLNYQR